MKILIVSQHFHPDNFRINDIAATLVEQGHDVTVLTSLPDYKTGKVTKENRGLKNRKVDYKGVKVVRCFSFARRTGLFFRALNYVSFLLSSIIKAVFIRKRFDVVMCYQTSPVLMANAARKVAKMQKIPFLIYCLDLWPESLKAWHVNEDSFLYKFMHKYSKKIYNSADILAVSSRPFMEYHNKVNGVPMEKMVILEQHSADVNLPKKQPKTENDSVVFVFGGNIGKVQNVECIIRATSLVSDMDGFSVEIYGEGSSFQNCKELARQLRVEDKINFHGWVDKEELWKEYDKADAFLLTLKPTGFISQTVPAKCQEYMSANRPIIASIDYASEIIEEAGCGVCVPSDDFRALARAMRKFIENRGEIPGAAENGRRYFETHYTIECFMNKFNKILDTLVKDK